MSAEEHKLFACHFVLKISLPSLILVLIWTKDGAFLLLQFVVKVWRFISHSFIYGNRWVEWWQMNTIEQNLHQFVLDDEYWRRQTNKQKSWDGDVNNLQLNFRQQLFFEEMTNFWKLKFNLSFLSDGICFMHDSFSKKGLISCWKMVWVKFEMRF